MNISLNYWDILFVILIAIVIVQTLCEIYRGETSLRTGTILILMSLLVIVYSFIPTNKEVQNVIVYILIILAPLLMLVTLYELFNVLGKKNK